MFSSKDMTTYNDYETHRAALIINVLSLDQISCHSTDSLLDWFLKILGLNV